MRYRLLLAILPSALLCASAYAGNLIFNSSFELGDTGFTCVKYLDVLGKPESKFSAPQQDFSTSASGKSSLRVPVPYGEKTFIIAKELKLKPGANYSFSVSLKSDMQPFKFGVLICSGVNDQKWGWDAHSGDFEVGKDWKRSSFNFKSKSPWPNEFYSVFLCFGPDAGVKPGSVWLDDIQIAEGSDVPYAPASELEVAAVSQSPYRIVKEVGDKAPLEIRAINYAKAPVNAEIGFKMLDERNGSSVFEQSFKADLKPGVEAIIPFDSPLFKFGTFSLESSVSGGKLSSGSFPGYLAVAGFYDRKPMDLANRMYMGFSYDSDLFKGPMNWGSGRNGPAIECTGMGPDDSFEMLGRMGVRVIRSWERWREQEPAEGKYDFKQADYELNLLERHGLALYPILGTGFIIKGSIGFPKWLSDKCRVVKSSGEWKLDVQLPPVEIWEKYVKAFASRYKGRISHYEIVNEPNGYIFPRDYVPYLKSAYQQLKLADPKVKVVGFCVTGDRANSSGGFLAECAKLGAMKYADAISFHPYDAVSLGFETPADVPINAIKSIIKENCGRPDAMQIWNTEIYYIRAGQNAPTMIEKERHEAYHFACRVMTDLGEGVSQSIFLELGQVWRNRYTGHFDAHLFHFGEPGPDIVAASAIASNFEDAKTLGRIKWGADTACYAFERKDRPFIAAIWNYGSGKVALKLGPQAARCRLLEMMGNEMPLQTEGLQLGPEPFYLEAPAGMDKKTFLSMLESAEITPDMPFATNGGRLIPEKGWLAVLPVRNNLNKDLAMSAALQGDSVSSPSPAACKLKAGSEGALKMPVKLKDGSAGQVKASLSLDGKPADEISLTVPAKIAKVSSAEPKAEKLDSSFPVSFKAWRDSKDLILSFDVSDATASGAAAGREMWEQDCIELFVDLAPEEGSFKTPGKQTDNITRLFILPYAPEGKRLVVYSGRKAPLNASTLSSSTRPGGYSATVKIPLKDLKLGDALKGRCVGFDFQVDDAAGASGKNIKKQFWCAQGDAHKNRLALGFIVFE